MSTIATNISFGPGNVAICSGSRCFCDLPLGLGFSAKTFFFDSEFDSIDYLDSSFTFYSNLSMYGLLANAQIWKYLVVSGLYPINILSQIFW